MIVEKKLFLHSTKDSNHAIATEDKDLLDAFGAPLMSEKALSNFSYALYEIGFNCEIDTETGDIEIVSVDVADGGDLFTR